MTDYNLKELAEVYYQGYLEAEHALWFQQPKESREMLQKEVSQAFDELPRSEQDCIIMALRRVVQSLDPDPKFVS